MNIIHLISTILFVKISYALVVMEITLAFKYKHDYTMADPSSWSFPVLPILLRYIRVTMLPQKYSFINM